MIGKCNTLVFMHNQKALCSWGAIITQPKHQIYFSSTFKMYLKIEAIITENIASVEQTQWNRLGDAEVREGMISALANVMRTTENQLNTRSNETCLLREHTQRNPTLIHLFQVVMLELQCCSEHSLHISGTYHTGPHDSNTLPFPRDRSPLPVFQKQWPLCSFPPLDISTVET